MINKKLLSFDRKALRYVGLNVLFQWLGMLCNVVLVMTVSRLIGGVFAGSLTGNALWQGMLLCLLTVPVRYGLTLCASDMSDRASKDVKRTLRSSIYAKLTRLGAGYSETVATSEAVMLASEGVEQIDTYFAKYLPQLFYSLLAPVTLFVLLVGVHARSAILLLCCVPLIPLSIVAVQKFAKKLLANYWGEYGEDYLKRIRYGAGACYDYGRLVLRGEYICGTTGDLDSEGWYAVAGWRVTRTLLPAVRYDTFLEDCSRGSSRQTNYTAGLTWQPVKYLRCQLDYTYEDFAARDVAGRNVVALMLSGIF